MNDSLDGFTDWPIPNAGIYVYAILDLRGTLLYIGCSDNPMRRILAHVPYLRINLDKIKVKLLKCANRFEGMAIERELIKNLKPRLNPGHHQRNPRLPDTELQKKLKAARGHRQQKEMAAIIGISTVLYNQAERHGIVSKYGQSRILIDAYLNRLDAKESGVME